MNFISKRYRSNKVRLCLEKSSNNDIKMKDILEKNWDWKFEIWGLIEKYNFFWKNVGGIESLGEERV